MLRELVIGLDIGTTSVKAVIFDITGKLIAETEDRITTYYPEPGWAEQDPKKIERSSVRVISEVIAKAGAKQDELLTVGISCAMHSLICVDENHEPLSQMLIWSDGRSTEQAEKLVQTKGNEIFLKTGTPIHPMSPFVKLCWIKANDYETYRKATYFMTMKEYLLQKWFGKRVIDYSMASSTGLMNLKTLDWDETILEIAGVKREQLAKIVAPTEVLPPIDKHIAAEMGISQQLPFVIGAADGPLANIGNGTIFPGEVNVSVGTSGAIRQFIKGTKVNETRETFTYAFTPDTSIIGGATNNGGIALQWLKELLEYAGTYEAFIAKAERVDAGADGVIFLPYVNGERAPLWNQRAKGNFYGLSIGHKKEQLIRAVLEGITFNIYQIGKSVEAVAGKPEKISVNGGLTKSPLWVQILADVFGQEIYLSDTHHSAAWGAAWTALIGIDRAKSFEAIKLNMPAEKVIKPNMQDHEVYMKIYDKYEKIAKDLAGYFSS